MAIVYSVIDAHFPWPTFQSAVSELHMEHCSSLDTAVLGNTFNRCVSRTPVTGRKIPISELLPWSCTGCVYKENIYNLIGFFFLLK